YPSIPFDLYTGETPESKRFLYSLRSVLVRAGWKQVDAIAKGIKLDGPGPAIGFSGLFTNLAVIYPPSRSNELQLPSLSLTDALRTEGITAVCDFQAGQENPSGIHILVGPKE